MVNKRRKTSEAQEKTKMTSIELESLDNDFYAPKDKIDFLFKVIGRYDLYINSTNTKASLIFAWNGIVIGTLLIKYSEIRNLFPVNFSFLMFDTIFFFTALCAVTSNILAFRVIFPSLKSNSSNDDSSIIYFGSVASNSAVDYFNKISLISNQSILVDLSDQVVTLAKITINKMQILKQSIRILYLEFYFIAVLFILKFFLSI